MARNGMPSHPLTYICTLVLFVTVLAFYRLDAYATEYDPTVTSAKESPGASSRFDDESLQFISLGAARTFIERQFLIVLGIPSLDIDARQRLRNLQRTSCWRFPGVATRLNNFTGAMLVLYVLARHPSHNFTYSAGLEAEAVEWNDVIALPMNEGRPSTNKTLGGGLKWGMEAEVGLSRKVFLWFDMALRLFPTATYFAKGDDDTFLRVPQYLADLRTLPREGVYWGNLCKWHKPFTFHFVMGFCMTLSKNVAERFVSYEPLQRLLRLPYSDDVKMLFSSLNMDHEDVMVGHVLHVLLYKGLVYVGESNCRFHDSSRGFSKRYPMSSLVAVQHVKPRDYVRWMKRFASRKAPAPRKYMFRKVDRRRMKLIQFKC
ncbi:UDP-Gal or UDP-GlcNAc-dependent glycosyltransferase [Trypanosoma grayi]|uniref:UDP-Gal or UDP-GlcNAc-dependent glycosyltransferase n=1 Tax=Trypanosoma grayi TaxID=71804 RepID=UPI0004F4582F|nr:UDP-Gal or UDP-GlcNAc-dependent glycosyltransferase [Trypanosoma grayi]KEG07875.1 UDP-Gal or UDP-GlcNAc-dependent glycosyltransferase [Trypanosoma grayi]